MELRRAVNSRLDLGFFLLWVFWWNFGLCFFFSCGAYLFAHRLSVGGLL